MNLSYSEDSCTSLSFGFYGPYLQVICLLIATTVFGNRIITRYPTFTPNELGIFCLCGIRFPLKGNIGVKLGLIELMLFQPKQN